MILEHKSKITNSILENDIITFGELLDLVGSLINTAEHQIDSKEINQVLIISKERYYKLSIVKIKKEEICPKQLHMF